MGIQSSQAALLNEAHRNIIAFPKLVGLASLKWFFMEDPYFPYTNNEETTEILILEDGEIPESIGTTPMIVVERGPIQFLNISMDQRLFAGFTQISNFQNTVTSHRDLVQSRLTMRCISSDRVVAEYIAHSTFACFHLFSPILRKMMKLHDIVVEVLPNDSSLMGPDGMQFQAHIVPVITRIQWSYQWQSHEKDPEVLRQIMFDMVADEDDMQLHLTDP